MKSPDVKNPDFACSCTDEGKAECGAVVDWACQQLTHAHRTVTRENLLTAVVFELAHGYRAAIQGIYCDMWCGISTDIYHPEGETEEFSTFIMCDKVEDGIAYTLKAYYDKFGDRRE